VRFTSARGPLLLAVLYAVPLVLWARTAPLDDRFTGSYTSLTSVAVLCALAGTSAFALNLVLGARLRVVEALFGGLDRMYRVHRANGQIAFFFLLGHVVLILASRATISADSALDLLGPGAGWTVFAGVIAFSALTVGIVMTLFVRLGHEVFVYVQRAFGFVFLVATYHVFTTDGAKSDSIALNAYMATLAALGVAAFLYRSLFGNLLVRRHPYRVRAVNRLDEFVTEIVMEPAANPLAFTPGQFVFVNFRSLALREQFRPLELSAEGQVFSFRAGEVSNQFHPFSITSGPGEPTLRITVKAVGDYTRALRTLEQGADAVVEGPYGSFSHRNVANPSQIWMAGGIGVTPFLSMARSLDGGDEPVVDFYYCVERREEAHFLDEFQAISDRRGDFRVHLVPRDEAGLPSARLVAERSGALSHRDVLICGPPAMIENLRAQFVARGLPPERIHAEEFGFAKLGRVRPKVDGAAERARPARAAPGGVVREAWRPSVVVRWALAFAALTFALGILVGRQTDGGSESPSGQRPGSTSGGAGSASAGEAVFTSAGCGNCHSLAAAGSTAEVGPNLDDTQPDAALVREVVANGKGTMPSFAQELSAQEIRDVAAFVSQSAAR
jgi:predicted ferric reductase/mono/diheme cytochrome c family protein